MSNTLFRWRVIRKYMLSDSRHVSRHKTKAAAVKAAEKAKHEVRSCGCRRYRSVEVIPYKEGVTS